MEFLKDMFLNTLKNPRLSMRNVIKIEFEKIDIFQLLIFMSIVSTILTYAFIQLVTRNLSIDSNAEADFVVALVTYLSLIQPIFLAFNQVFQMLLFGMIIFVGGHLFRGKGSIWHSISGVILIEYVLLYLKLLQIVLFPISAILSVLVVVPGTLWSFWAFASVAAEIHGFKSTFKTFMGGLLISFMVLTVMNILF